MGHYLMVVLPDGKENVRREYLPLEHEHEERDDAFARWLDQHPDIVNRVRNRDKAREAIRASVIYTELCHPTSWWRTQPPVKFARRK